MTKRTHSDLYWFVSDWWIHTKRVGPWRAIVEAWATRKIRRQYIYGED